MKDRKSQAGPDPARRAFLSGSGAVLGVSWLAAQFPAIARAAQAALAAQAAGREFAHLSPDEALDLEAVAARIIPSDDTPGAREAGVIWFIDEALGSFMADGAAALKSGLAGLNARVAAQTGIARFALLDEAGQDETLRQIEADDWFGEVQFLTLAGLLTLPSYGGNADHAGWKLIGFEHRHVWMPPFGYYDADDGEAEGRGHG